MESGVQTLVVTCRETPGDQGLCPSGFSQHLEPAFLLDPSQAPLIEASLQPFTAAEATMIFGQTFGITLTLWLFAYVIGQVIRVFRRFSA